MNANSKIKINMDSLKTAKEWVRHKVKPGHNIFRVLPPLGDSANGYPYRKYQIIWGLVDANGRMRPYASPLMTEKRCPVVEFTDALKQRLSEMEGQLKASGLDEKAMKKHPKYASLAKFSRDMTPKTSYIYNASDKSGVLGLLELKSTAHKDMKNKMNQYIQDYNQDPTSLNSADDDSGLWFDVVREGDGFLTTYKVEKCQVKVKDASGRISFTDDRSPLADVIVENYANLGYDLGSVYKATTYDEVNDVLQANMPAFFVACPEADLSVPVNLDEDEAEVATAKPAARPVAAPVAAKSAVKPTAKVALKLDDEDDMPVAAPIRAKAPVAASSSVLDDDDFMNEADAILNG